MQGILRLTATAALGGLALLGCSDDGGSSDDETDDVKVASCTASPGGDKPVAQGTIANGTSKASGYTFQVKFLDPAGNEVSQATNGVGKVEPGATATWTAQGSTSAKGQLTCKVENVTRTALP